MTPGGTAAVVLAAGLGTRMRSGRAKVLHPVGGLPLVTWCVRAVRPLAERVVVVVGHERDAVREALAKEDVGFAVQDEQHGTGHALACALPEIGGARRILLTLGDVPGLTTTTLEALVEEHESRRASATVLTFVARDPAGYGRIVRGPDGSVDAIVEHAKADAATRCIDEVNSGTYLFECEDLMPVLPALPRHGQEIYVTDALAALRARGLGVAARVAPEDECAGINTQAQLAEVQATWHAARVRQLMDAGVTVVDPAQVSVEADVSVGAGSVLQPFVALEGATRIGERCRIGSFVRLRDVDVAAGATVDGPFAQVGGRIPSRS